MSTLLHLSHASPEVVEHVRQMIEEEAGKVRSSSCQFVSQAFCRFVCVCFASTCSGLVARVGVFCLELCRTVGFGTNTECLFFVCGQGFRTLAVCQSCAGPAGQFAAHLLVLPFLSIAGWCRRSIQIIVIRTAEARQRGGLEGLGFAVGVSRPARAFGPAAS